MLSCDEIVIEMKEDKFIIKFNFEGETLLEKEAPILDVGDSLILSPEKKKSWFIDNAVEMKGYSIDEDKFAQLQSTYWEIFPDGAYKCKKHGTIFEDEPCWQCWDECKEEV